MILYRWQGAARNFGDELNTVLWPRLLPGFFDGDPASRFLGIGSVLDGRHGGGGLKLVAGSGYGGYQQLPTLDRAWDIRWVRGPRTALKLGLPIALGLGDPASLLPKTGLVPRQKPHRIGFMPHFESAAGGAWHAAATANGIALIDPRGDPLAIASAIAGCHVLLSEALHGAIVADALGVPWVAIEPLAPIHRPKWYDWADTLDLTLRFHQLPASSLLERARVSPVAAFHAGRGLLDRHAEWLRGVASDWFVDRAACALHRAALAAPQLSCRSVLDRCQTRMLEQLHTLRKTPLHPCRGSAYQTEPLGQ
jgi:succinoglycan biosynthesis protein ExoV